MSYTLSIVVPVFNKFNFTSACLNDLFRLPQDHEIVVVDNGSTDSTSSLAQISRPNFKYIKNETNEGFAKACNRGFAESSGETVMFLNNDIRVQKDHETWTKKTIELAHSTSMTKDGVPITDNLVSPTIGVLDDNLNFVAEGISFVGKWYMSGWNLTAKRESFQKLVLPNDLGPFSTEFGIAYFEDTDLSFRAKEMNFGFHLSVVPVIHFGRVTSTSIGLSALYKPAQEIFKNKWLK